jgi:type IV pilus assembly protein PilY1
MMSQFRHGSEPERTRTIARGWLAVACAALVILSASTRVLDAAIDLSDTPMFARVLPPPANIMFLLDDSGSMNFEILVQGGYDGSYPNPDPTVYGFCFVFDDLGDSVLSQNNNASLYAGSAGRLLWQTQYYKTNVMYYNPNITYLPWPSYDTITFLNAGPDKPRSHPLNSSPTLDLQGTSFTIGAQNVPHAHYFVYSAIKAAPYLVVIDKTSAKINYYKATLTGTGLAAKVSALTLDTAPPADVVSTRTYSAERQNFANWFTYHRRREFVAKNALANVIKNLSNVRVGIYGINKQIVTTLQPVNVTQGATITDSTKFLLDKLFPYQSSGDTPLKQGLDTVGKFFKSNTGTIGGVSGTTLPYDTTAPGAACQQSFTVILTDGYYSDRTYAFGGGNADGDNGAPYADNISNTLADIAMYYYENDLNSLPNQVPTSKYDQANTQHMATYAVAFGVSGRLNPQDYDESFHDKNGQLVKWPTSIGDRAPEAIDDLWHTTVNGHGKFYNAGDPQALTSSLNDLMNAISEILIGSSSSVTVNGDYLYGKVGSNTFIYQGLYSNKDGEWTGDVKAYPVDAVTGDVLITTPRWSAAEQLEKKLWNERVIATFDGTAGVPFQIGSLTDSQKTALDTNSANAASKLMYLRGEAVSGYRYRSQKLGDIVDSAPVFLDDVIYVGGNDGMLHAFDATTGVEIFSYVPNLVFGNLQLLTDPAYTHRFYVDLTPTLKKGKDILGAGKTDTLLVGGLRKGGKGYFGLNVTDSKSITTEDDLAKRVLWEFPKTSDPDMGYSFSKPVVVRSNSTDHPWVVIFGNGYNSDNGKSALYIVDAKTGDWITRIDAGAGPDNGLSTPIAVDPTHDEKVDFVYAGDLKGNLWKFDLRSSTYSDWSVAFINKYVPQPLFQAKGPGGTVQPITTRPDVMYHPEKQGFIVCFGTGKYLGESDYDTSLQSVYGIWDYGDTVYDLRTQKWSVDDDTEFLGAFERDGAKKLSNQPQTVSLLQQTQQVYQGYRFLSSSHPTWLTQNDPQNGQEPDPSETAVNHAGYYFDLGPSERVISDVIIRNKLLLAIGFTPNNDRCGPGGNSMFMEINAFTGGTAGGSLFDITGDLQIDAHDIVKVTFNGTSQDLAPSGKEFLGNIQPPAILGLPGSDQREKKYLSSSTGNIEQLHEKGAKLGVAYWMEIHY